VSQVKLPGRVSLRRVAGSENDAYETCSSKIEVLSTAMMDWKELSRPDQKTLQRLYGGGSLRNCDPDAISRLRQLGLIEGKESRERLTPFGRALLDHTHAQLKARLGTP
jgi:coproporphyrinogen III oxidase-like Fe-S oxidoreductase